MSSPLDRVQDDVAGDVVESTTIAIHASMTALYRNPDEQAQHFRAISSLSRELQVPEVKVRLVYEEELRRITTDTRIREYLVVFARRGARECLLCDGKSRTGKCAERSRCPVESPNAGGAGDAAGASVPGATT